jgi:hypothetical protein
MSSFGPFSVGKAVLDWMSAFLSKCGGSWKRMLALLIDHRLLALVGNVSVARWEPSCKNVNATIDILRVMLMSHLH